MLMLPTPNEFSLAGIDYSTSEINALTETILYWLHANSADNPEIKENKLVTYINPHVYNLSMNDNSISSCLEKADRVCIDGVGIKLALLFMRQQWLPRVVAEHLFNSLVIQLAHPVTTVLIGVEPDEVSAAAKALHQCNPNLNIIDTVDGFAQMPVYRQYFKQHYAVQLVLIGAGTPKSEQIALAAMQTCRGSVIMHIGAGTIKTWAGTKRRGPALLSWMGLEWLHRVFFEPHTRTRYTVGALSFAFNLIRRRNVHKDESIGGGYT